MVPYPGDSTPWRCRCNTCQREVSPRHSDMKRGQGGCVYCGGTRVDPREADAIARRAGVEPLVPYPGDSVPWQSRCLTCNREVNPRHSDMKQGQGGCIFCARSRKGGATTSTFQQGAEAVLADVGHPMTSKVLWAEISKRGLVTSTGTTPEATLYTELMRKSVNWRNEDDETSLASIAAVTARSGFGASSPRHNSRR